MNFLIVKEIKKNSFPEELWKCSSIARIYLFLVSESLENGEVDFSLRYVSSRMKIPVSTIRTNLNRLQELGIIIKKTDELKIKGIESKRCLFDEESIVSKETATYDKENLLTEFEEFRKIYPGRKRGRDVEFENLKRKHPKKWMQIIPLLKPAVVKMMDYRSSAEEANARGERIFIPSPANLSTWINNSRWEDEYPEIPNTKIYGNRRYSLDAKIEEQRRAAEIYAEDLRSTLAAEDSTDDEPLF